MKKVLSIVLTLTMVLGMFVGIELPASAATSGTTGNCTWTLDGTKLTISGNGEMGDYLSKDQAPWGTEITEVVIENGVTSIGNYAFEDCTGLTSITIPDSVTSIGGSAFYNTAYYNNDANWENGVLYIGNRLIDAKNSISGEYTIKAGTVTLANCAFDYCRGLTSITIPNSVTSIEVGAFFGCIGLTSITIPNSVTSIGDFAFEDCAGLTSITIPNSVTSIGDGAFYSCTGLTSITIPNSVTSIGGNAFSNCTGLTSITIPDSVTSIGNRAFYYCIGLTSITIPDSVTSIGHDAFWRCTGLTDVWYTGSEADKAEITIGSYNDALLNATWHYNTLVIGDDIEIVDGKVKVPTTSGYFTDKNGKLCFPGEYIDAEAGDVFTPAPIEVAADNAFSVRLDSVGIRARGALSKETVEAASEIGFVIVPRIAPDLSADWYVSSQYTYKQPVNKNAIYGPAKEVDGYQYQLCLWDLRGVEAEDFLFAMYATVDGVTTYTYVGCVSYNLVSGALSK